MIQLEGSRRWPLKIVWTVTVLAIVGVTATAAFAGSASSGRYAATTLSIGILDSQTGRSSSFCVPEIEGMNLALAEAAHRREVVGGKSVPFLRGVAFKLDVQDDQSTAAPAVTGLRALVDDGAVAVVGPCSSVSGAAIDPLIDSAKIPVVFSTAGATGLTDPRYAFRAGLPFQTFSGRAIQVLKGQGVKTIYGIYTSDNPTFVDTWTAMKQTMKVIGVNLVGEYSVLGTTVDFNPAIQHIKELKPDAIALLTANSIPALTQLRSAGIDTQVFGSANFAVNAVLQAGAIVKGALLATTYAPSFTYKSSVRFTKEYETKYGHIANAQAANGYDAMWRVLQAVHDAGPTRVAAATVSKARDLIQAALASQKSMSGAQGPITFTSTGDSKGPAGVGEIVDDKGTIKLLKVPSVASLLGKKK